ncbi:MAG: spermidine synthase [Planctomycetota bacterium]
MERPLTAPGSTVARDRLGLGAALLCSGGAALVFETVWFRQVGLTIGNGVWASAMVLAAFMGGLALGNAAAARWGGAVERPLRGYAGLEVVTGALGVALALLLPALPALVAPALWGQLSRPWLINLARFSLCFALLLLPTVAMGATLPLLVRGLVARGLAFGQSLGWLYGLNTLGAVAGALLGELVLIEHLGVRGAAAAAALGNLAAAAIVLVVERTHLRDSEAGGSAPAPAPAQAGPGPAPTASAPRLLAAAFLAGAAFLSLEVVWFRRLLLTSFGTSLSFAVMLAVVLAGIGVGGLLGPRLARAERRLTSALAWALGGCVVFGHATLDLANPTAYQQPRALGSLLLSACWLMLPTAAGSGALFTLLGARLRPALGDDARAAGLLTFANTTGALLGSLLGAFVLLPWLGVDGATFALALCYAVVGALALPPLPSLARADAHVLAPAALALGVGLLAYPHGLVRRGLERVVPQGERTLMVRESATQTIVYSEKRLIGARYFVRMSTNCHSMSSTAPAVQAYMRFFVYLPVALHPAPRRALLICFGVGCTAQALVATPQLERIDVVDVARDVLELSDVVYPDPAQHPLRDPRVHVTIEDGRFFLQATPERWDLITGEPPPPAAAGVVNLYSREMFELIRARLNPGGMATWWLPIYQMDEPTSRAIVQAFVSVFPDSSLWIGAGQELVLLGVNAPARTTREAFERQWREPGVAPTLRALGFEQPGSLGACFLADGADLARRFAGTAPVTDDFPHRLAPAYAAGPGERDYWALVAREGAWERFAASSHVRALWPPEVLEASRPWFRWRELAHAARLSSPPPPPGGTLRALDALLRSTELVGLPLWLLGCDDQLLAIAEAVDVEAQPGAWYVRGCGALSRRDFAGAAERFQRGLRAGDQGCRLLRVYALLRGDKAGEGRALLAELRERGAPGVTFPAQELGFLLELANGRD